MKKYISMLCILFSFCIQAQKLWGTMYYNQNYFSSSLSTSAGAVFSLDANGNNFEIKKDFEYQEIGSGAWLQHSLMRATDGYFYTSTAINPLILRIDSLGNYKTLKGSNMSPTTNLVQRKDGNLWGVQLNNVFKMNLDGNAIVTSTFSGFASSNILLTREDVIYGYCTTGLGSVFSVDTNGQFASVYNFTTIDGFNPSGCLVEDSIGSLYGVCKSGGVYGNGIIFKISKTGIFEKLHDFSTVSGLDYANGLTANQDGYLYGISKTVTQISNSSITGVVKLFVYKIKYGNDYSIEKNISTDTVILRSENYDGFNYNTPLISDTEGNMYGLVYGNVIKYIPSKKSFSILATPTDRGQHAFCGLFLYNNYLYGNITSYNKYEYDENTIFKIHKDSTVYHKFLRLNYPKYGYSPKTSLTVSQSNKLMIGATVGSNYWSSQKYPTLYNIDSLGNYKFLTELEDANDEITTPTLTKKGNIFFISGTFKYSINENAIYKFDTSNKCRAYFAFSNTLKGMNATGGLIESANGKLYGMTMKGGLNNKGVIYSIDQKDSTQFLKHFDFNNTSGFEPVGELVEDANHFLWGTTSKGGEYGFGSVFKIDTNGVYTKLVDFDSLQNGATPLGNILWTERGWGYGLTSKGGLYNQGVLFRISSNGVFEKLHDFRDSDTGAFPEGTLIEGSDGTLFGTTPTTIFKVDTLYEVTKLYRNENDFFKFSKSLVLSADKSNVINTVKNQVFDSDLLNIYPNPVVNQFIFNIQAGTKIECLYNNAGMRVPFSIEGNKVILPQVNPGLYFIIFETSKGIRYSQKFVVE